MLKALWNKVFGRPKIRLHLGSITVAPRTDVLRHLESGVKELTSDVDLKGDIVELLSLQEAPARGDAQDSDVAIDIVIIRYRIGEFLLGDSIPVIAWRPMVQLASRAYFVKSGREFSTVGLTHRMPWRQFLNRAVQFRVFTPFATRSDMKLLMGQALGKLILKLKARE